jgi:hypothetical protein
MRSYLTGASLPRLPKTPILPKLPLPAECDFTKRTQFSKNKNEPKPLYINDLQRNIPSQTTRKTNPIEPNFQVRPSKRSADPSARWDPSNHGPAIRSPQGEGGSRALIMQNKPNLQKCKNEPNHLFAKDLRKNHPRQFNQFGLQFSTIRELKRCFRDISRAIRDNSRQLALIRDKIFCRFILPRLFTIFVPSRLGGENLPSKCTHFYTSFATLRSFFFTVRLFFTQNIPTFLQSFSSHPRFRPRRQGLTKKNF